MKVLIFTNIAPLYRKPLWLEFLKNKDYNYQFIFGSNERSNIREINFDANEFDKYRDKINLVKNIYFKKRYLIWQKSVIKICYNTDAKAVILTGDLWVLSNWIASILLRTRGIKVNFWSHGIYGNEFKLKKFIRKLFFKLANDHLLYERRGKKMMIKSGFKKNNLHVIFNSLDYVKSKELRIQATQLIKQDVYPFFANVDLPVIIFVGRLTKIKKLDLIIEALNNLSNKKIEMNLLFVGDGSEKEELEKLSVQKMNKENFYFYGACYSEEKLAKLISMADLCVSPGNVGLTAIHSLSYGTPVLTHNNFNNQMPEVEVISDGLNGCFFEENDIESLANSIAKWLLSKDAKSRNDIRKDCYKVIDTFYNPEYQMQVVKNLLNGGDPLV
ncbi:glycosyltransferase [Cellulophaga baltica]|uniref:glycosyltransferase n=1 Tax=Cellulophaga baltica TaxID=76594 RepID=UPI0015F413C2|nr:glycosyltransferase [Cellulophaga baltica]MBA6314710.1 glycosyltransferase [Cellulophaga baltica]